MSLCNRGKCWDTETEWELTESALLFWLFWEQLEFFKGLYRSYSFQRSEQNVRAPEFIFLGVTRQIADQFTTQRVTYLQVRNRNEIKIIIFV